MAPFLLLEAKITPYGFGKLAITRNNVYSLSFTSIAAEALFNPKPLREYTKHKADVLDISWCSKVSSLINEFTWIESLLTAECWS